MAEFDEEKLLEIFTKHQEAIEKGYQSHIEVVNEVAAYIQQLPDKSERAEQVAKQEKDRDSERVGKVENSGSDINKEILLRVPSNVSLIAQKKKYIEELKKLTSTLKHEEKVNLAHYLLSSDDNLLKRERGFLRGKSSNETRSMHEVVQFLLRDVPKEMATMTLKNKLLHIKIGEDQEFKLSRHVSPGSPK